MTKKEFIKKYIYGIGNDALTDNQEANDMAKDLDSYFTEQLRQNNVKDTIKTLRTIFKVSNAVFEFQNSIQLSVSGYISISKMHQLHKKALNELEKENPDLSIIDNLMLEMEITAGQAKSNK